jgi:hypothetical protein
MLFASPLGDAMARTRDLIRILLSAVVSLCMVVAPLYGGSEPGYGTVMSAERAHVGTSAASIGTTVLAGDVLTTDELGVLQVRSAGARLLLGETSRVMWTRAGEAPEATLTNGTASFSTAESRSFAVHVANAMIQPSGTAPAVGSVTMLNPKELTVQCMRGALLLTVEGDTLAIPEGSAYHIMLDPDASAVAASDNGGNGQWGNKPPRKSAKDKFLFFLIGGVAIVTAFAVHKALESPDRP